MESVGLARRVMNASYGLAAKAVLRLLEGNVIPDFLIRRLTRLLLAARLKECLQPTADLQLSQLMTFVQALKQMPIAVSTEAAKVQHYELPTAFFKLVLGQRLKYSSAYFSSHVTTLEEAEEAMLALYCERAEVKDGLTILDLGCGWGSLILYIAEKYPKCEVTGVCNSLTQMKFIEEQCRYIKKVFGLSIEENHMKNYGNLLEKISQWMNNESLLFVHHFCHKSFAYHFEDTGEDDWITRYFFTGGTMPSSNLLLYFQDNVSIVNHWLINGRHYAQTSEEWLKRMEKNLSSILPIFNDTYGENECKKWLGYWRTFFISVAELFSYNDGEEWMITHLLFRKRS